ncbi:SsrA-binding protein SmpB [Sulfurimonas sp. MAG313]|nr:SsrA-binding protein SmpB [Sulfurimonas sp. MAG313]MDF1880255.1 SsrA-binding protein SmpB [Sulfurimonas sp. MAG313]
MGETIAKNKKAYHNFTIEEKLEVGIELQGSEVKALRKGRAQIKESYVRFIKGELFLMNSHIGILDTTHAYYKHDERRVRKLLLHKKQLAKFARAVDRDGMTMVCLSLYFNHKNLVKAQIATAKGKQLHDKRADLKAKDMKRDVARSLKDY